MNINIGKQDRKIRIGLSIGSIIFALVGQFGFFSFVFLAFGIFQAWAAYNRHCPIYPFINKDTTK